MRALVFITVLLAGCYAKPVDSVRAGDDVRVDRLFTHEQTGITVYRFRDGPNFVYFTDRGEVCVAKCEGERTTCFHKTRCP